MFCINCGKKIPDSSKYCMYCGTNLEIYKSIIEDNNINDKRNSSTSISNLVESKNNIETTEREDQKSVQQQSLKKPDKIKEYTSIKQDNKQPLKYRILSHIKKIDLMNIIKSKKFILIASSLILFCILISSAIIVYNKTRIKVESNAIIGTWSNDSGIELTVAKDSYSFIEDKSNPNLNYDDGKCEIYTGIEGLKKAGYSEDKINEISSQYDDNQIVTLYTTIEKQSIDGINVSKIKNKNDFYIFILKNNDNAFGIRILDEKKFHLKKC